MYNFIHQLIKARKLNSDEECELFQFALQQLWGNIKIDDISEICKAFYDETEDYESMFELIHLIEQLRGEEYLKCIALHSPIWKMLMTGL